ncbi:MAG: glutathione binding-like protein [Candidatus Binatia bacterium]
MWNRRVELYLLNPIGMVWIHGNPMTAKIVERIPENVEPSRKRAADFFTLLDQTLEERPFIAGDSYSVANITALITVDFGRFIEVTAAPELANLARWYADVSARPSAKA